VVGHERSPNETRSWNESRSWLALACGLLAALLILAPRPGREDGLGAEVLTGPVQATLIEVIDGDTLKVRARIWLGQEVETSVRLSGIDAPEHNGTCASERRLAAAATEFLHRQLAEGALVLNDIVHDKYGGRVVARVATEDGRDLGRSLVAAGLARHYDGGARPDWCAAAR
jgi:endonuclease YncB( thermonuclease family)